MALSELPPVVSLMPNDILLVRRNGTDYRIRVENLGLGSSVGANFIVDEIPAGGIDGVNRIFTTAFEFAADNLWVYLNGIRLQKEHFTVLTSNSFELQDIPLIGDTIVVDYMR